MIKRLLQEVKEYKTASILTPIFMIGEVIFETLIPFIMGLIINNGINGNNGKGDTNYIVMMGVIMFVFALLGLIAGMGGELILHILTEGESVCSTAKELILQPQSEIHKVREYLRQHQYKIEDEDMVCEEGKYYPMMRAVKTEQDETWNRLNDQTIAVCDIYGPLLLRNGNPVLRRFLVRQHGQLTQILQTLEAQKESEQIIRRIAEVQEKLQQNESAYTILGAIKSAGI